MQGEFPLITTAVAIFCNCYYDSFSEVYNNVLPSLGYIRTPGTALDLALELLTSQEDIIGMIESSTKGPSEYIFLS